MARGNRRELIFHDEDDRRFFLKALSEACEMTGWLVHAWVLMGNHYHLFIQTPEPNLVKGMSWLQNTYTRRYNIRHRAWGRVFGDRYKAVIVEGEDRYHYQTLLDYIHLNPVRARMVRPKDGQSVLDYPWSSLAGGYALPANKRAKWLAAEAGLKAFDLEDSVKGRRQMVERLDRRAVEEAIKRCGVPELPSEVDSRCSHLRRGWYWGTQGFADKLRVLASSLLQQVPHQSRAYRGTPLVREHGEKQAAAWLREGLKAAGVKSGELRGLKGSDARKVVLADLLWRQTTVSQEWIAGKLAMKSAANVCQQLRRMDRRKVLSKLPRELVEFYEKHRQAKG